MPDDDDDDYSGGGGDGGDGVYVADVAGVVLGQDLIVEINGIGFSFVCRF